MAWTNAGEEATRAGARAFLAEQFAAAAAKFKADYAALVKLGDRLLRAGVATTRSVAIHSLPRSDFEMDVAYKHVYLRLRGRLEVAE